MIIPDGTVINMTKKLTAIYTVMKNTVTEYIIRSKFIMTLFFISFSHENSYIFKKIKHKLETFW